MRWLVVLALLAIACSGLWRGRYGLNTTRADRPAMFWVIFAAGVLLAADVARFGFSMS